MPFTDNRPGPLGSESNAPATLVNNTVFTQFLAEGLRYLGRIRLVSDLEMPGVLGSNSGVEPERDANGNWRVRAVRCTPEGDVYAGSMIIPGGDMESDGTLPTGLDVAPQFADFASLAGLQPSSPSASATSVPTLAMASLPSVPLFTATSVLSPINFFRLPRWNLFGRRLAGIVGPDNRGACPALKYPFTAIGQIEVTDPTGLFICTGTLIAPNKVLTAGHCVWNAKRNAFYNNLNFAPGRYRAGDRYVNPSDVVKWKSVTVFDAFKRNPNTWDIAVVTLSKSVGKIAGTMGLAAGCMRNQRLWIGGYPQDKSQGTCETATCLQPYLNCNALLNPHYCDTVSGMSGSPLWDADFKVRMVHVAGIEGRQENRGTTMTQFLVNSVMRW